MTETLNGNTYTMNEPNQILEATKPLYLTEDHLDSLRCNGDPKKFLDNTQMCLTRLGHRICGKDKILVISGLKKSRKSYLGQSILTSRFTKDRHKSFEFDLKLEDNEITLTFETEHDLGETEERKFEFNNACNISGDDNRHISINVRDHPYNQKQEIIMDYIRMWQKRGYKIGAIFIDQIADLLKGKNYNDTEAVSQLMETLQAYKIVSNALIICTIHTNRGGSDTMGWLGSMLDQVAYGVLLCTKDRKTGMTEVSHISRSKEMDPFCFGHDIKGKLMYDEASLGPQY